MRIIGNITAAELESLHASGAVVAIYPRKREACVSGFKRYRIVGRLPDLAPRMDGPDGTIARVVSEGLGENIDHCPSDNG